MAAKKHLLKRLQLTWELQSKGFVSFQVCCGSVKMPWSHKQTYFLFCFHENFLALYHALWHAPWLSRCEMSLFTAKQGWRCQHLVRKDVHPLFPPAPGMHSVTTEWHLEIQYKGSTVLRLGLPGALAWMLLAWETLCYGALHNKMLSRLAVSSFHYLNFLQHCIIKKGRRFTEPFWI